MSRTIYTSCFPRSFKIPRHVHQVSIALKEPEWWKPPKKLRCDPLLIKGWMFKLEGAKFTRAYLREVAKYDARKVVDALPEGDVVLMCWEAPNIGCHRRDAAEWLEGQLGIEVTEWGYARGAVMESRLMPEKADMDRLKKAGKTQAEPDRPAPQKKQLRLF